MNANDIHRQDQQTAKHNALVDQMVTAMNANLAEGMEPGELAVTAAKTFLTDPGRACTVAGFALVRLAEVQSSLNANEGSEDARLAIAGAKVDELTAERDNLVAYNRAVKGANDDLRAQLTAANRRAYGAEADRDSLRKGHTAYANENARLRSQLAETPTKTVRLIGEELTAEPGPEVTKTYDRDGDMWVRSPKGWRYRTANGDGDPWPWAEVAKLYGPLSARVEPTAATR